MKNFDENLNDKSAEFGRNLLYSLFGIFLFYIFLFIWLQQKYPDLPQIPISILVISFLGTGYSAYLYSKAILNFKTKYTIIAVSFFCLILYLSMVLCHASHTIFYFYIPILLLVLLARGVKVAAVTSILFILLCIFTKPLAEFFNVSQPTSLSYNQKSIIQLLEWVEVFIVAYLSFFLLYYYTELKKTEAILTNTIPLLLEEINQSETNVEIINEEQPENFDEKLIIIFHRIIDFFETEKPYQKSDFSIKKLADLLDTNTTYISRALNIYGKKNFSTLVNEYRIAQIKDELAKNTHLKFTLEYVYSKAGFTKQPTFNRVFKEQTGVTPSEYLESLKYVC